MKKNFFLQALVLTTALTVMAACGNKQTAGSKAVADENAARK